MRTTLDKVDVGRMVSVRLATLPSEVPSTCKRVGGVVVGEWPSLVWHNQRVIEAVDTWVKVFELDLAPFLSGGPEGEISLREVVEFLRVHCPQAAVVLDLTAVEKIWERMPEVVSLVKSYAAQAVIVKPCGGRLKAEEYLSQMEALVLLSCEACQAPILPACPVPQNKRASCVELMCEMAYFFGHMWKLSCSDGMAISNLAVLLAAGLELKTLRSTLGDDPVLLLPWDQIDSGSLELTEDEESLVRSALNCKFGGVLLSFSAAKLWGNSIGELTPSARKLRRLEYRLREHGCPCSSRLA